MAVAADCRLAILASRPLPAILAEWAGQFARRRVWRGPPSPAGIAAARDAIVAWYLTAAEPWLVMLDDDMIPLAETAELIASEEPIASAACLARSGRPAHPHRGFSAAACKLHRAALERIGPPWFAKAGAADGACECNRFWGRAVRAGYAPRQVGAIGHLVAAVLIPGEAPIYGRPPSAPEALARRRAAGGP